MNNAINTAYNAIPASDKSQRRAAVADLVRTLRNDNAEAVQAGDTIHNVAAALTRLAAQADSGMISAAEVARTAEKYAADMLERVRYLAAAEAEVEAARQACL